jgi:hypothetical protein
MPRGIYERHINGEDNPCYRHGGTGTRICNIWYDMKKRCKHSPDYFGIDVCDAWKNDFVAFRDWSLASGYDDTKCIHRIDNTGNYSPQNCVWKNFGKHTAEHHMKPVNQFDLDGNLLATYPSMNEAERQTGIDITTIWKNVRGKIKRPYTGFKWTYAS